MKLNLPKLEMSEIITAAARGGDLSWFWGLLPDPDEVLARLGATSAKILYTVLADPRVTAAVSSRKAATKSKKLEVHPGSEGAAEAKAAEAAEEMIKAWELRRIIGEILDAPLWGASPLEIIWQPEGNAWRIADLVGKPVWWFGYDDKKQLRFLTHNDIDQGQLLPERKILIARHEATYHNPYGTRLLSRCYWPVVFRRGGWQMWLNFVEKFGGDMVTAEAPSNWDTAQCKELADALAAMMSNSVLVAPEGTKLTVFGSKSKSESGGVHQALVAACDSEIALTILGANLTQEIKGQGSRAAAETHNSIREDLATEDQALVTETLNRALAWWAQYNHPGVIPPIVKFWKPKEVNKELAERDKTLTGQGVKFKKAYYSRAYNLADDEFEIRESEPVAEPKPDPEPEPKKTKQPQKAKMAAPPSGTAAFAKGDKAAQIPADIAAWLSARDTDLEALAKAAIPAAGVTNLAQGVLNIIDKATSLDDLPELLSKGHQALPVNELAQGVERAVFAAHNHGRWAVGQEWGGGAALEFAAKVELEPLPMKEAIDFWKTKIPVSPKTYKKLPDEAKLRAFAVAGLAKGDMLSGVWQALDDSLAEGLSLGQFKARVKDDLAKHGWIKPGELTKTGKLRRSAGRRLETIFLNNVLTSYNVGRYAQMTDPDVLKSAPYWMYVAVDDSRTREAHRAMNGRVFEATDPIWDLWYPLNGHRCRCTVISLTESQLKKRGLKVEPGKPILSGRAQPIPLPGGQLSGIDRIIHPDVGWSFNPGKAAWGGHVDRVIGKDARLEEWPTPLPGHDSYRLPAAHNLKNLDPLPKLLPDMKALKAKGMSNSQAAKHYRAKARQALKIEAGERTVMLPDGEAVIISERLFTGKTGRLKLDKGNRGRHIPAFADTLERPDEIWLTPMMDTNGQVILRRRHLKFWRGQGENVAGFSVAEFEGQAWRGVTVYDVAEGQKALDKNYRRGALLWKGKSK